MTTAGDRRSEQGSVAMATLLLVFAALLAAAVAQSGIGGLRDAVADTDRSAASAMSELGLSEAITRIDHGETTTFDGSVTTPSGRVRYEATRVAEDSWEIYSEGTAGRSTQARTIRLGRESRFPFALFAAEGVTLVQSGITGTLGSNGPVRISGRAPSEPVSLYGPSASCTGCESSVRLDGPRTMADPVVPPTTRACPVDGVFSGDIDGGAGVAFLCDDPSVPVVFERSVRVSNGPLAVHVAGDVPITMDRAVVNPGGRADEVLVLVHRPAVGPAASLSMEGTSFSGLLYAPSRSVTTGSMRVSGSVVVERFEQTSPGRVSAAYDSAVAGLDTAPWGVYGWARVTPR